MNPLLSARHRAYFKALLFFFLIALYFFSHSKTLTKVRQEKAGQEGLGFCTHGSFTLPAWL